MTIEISDVKYWKEMNYYDGLLYCSMLDIDGYTDWRLMTNLEWNLNDIQRDWRHVWLEGDNIRYPDSEWNRYWIIPVRNI